MKGIAKILLLMGTLAAALPISCMSDDSTRGRLSDAAVTLTLKVPEFPGHRGMNVALENKVNVIDVLVFDSKLLLRSVPRASYGGGSSFTVKLPRSRHDGDTYRIVVLANCETKINDLFGDPGSNGDRAFELNGYSGLPYTYVISLLEGNGPDENDSFGDGIIMWSEYKDPIIVSENSKYPEMRMIRSVARIDVGTNPDKRYVDDVAQWSEMDGFSLEEVYVFKASTGMTYAPDRDNFDFSLEKAIVPTLPAGNSVVPKLRYGSQFIERVNGKGICLTSSIYVAEADVKMESGTPGDKNHFNRLAIVVGGYYKGNENITYYRIELTGSDATDNALLDVLRNSCYQVSINSVTGTGFSTPDEAYNSHESRIHTTVTQWNDSPQNIVVDGQYRFELNEGTVWFDNDGGMREVWIKTDHPEGIEVGIPSDKWIGVGRIFMVDETLRLEINAAENNTGLDRSGTIDIWSGNFKYTLKIEQLAEPWIRFEADEFYPMDGQPHSFDVIAVSTWVIEEITGEDRIGTLEPKSGGANATSTKSQTVKCTFVPPDTSPDLKEDTVQPELTFRDPGGFWPDKTLTLSLIKPDAIKFESGF